MFLLQRPNTKPTAWTNPPAPDPVALISTTLQQSSPQQRTKPTPERQRRGEEQWPAGTAGAHLWPRMAGDQAGQLQRLAFADGVDPLRVALLLDVARQA